MPYPDGSSTPTEVNEQINRLLNVFRSHVPTTDERYPGMVREYAEALTRFPPHSLKAGVSWLISHRKEKFWPTPAEISDAVAEATDNIRLAALPAAKPDFRADLARRNEALRQRRIAIVSEFESNQARLCLQAKSEGWGGLLDTAVRAAANILAQRDMKRAEGIDVYPCEFPNIATIHGVEQIAIDQSEINRWRSYWITDQKGAA